MRNCLFFCQTSAARGVFMVDPNPPYVVYEPAVPHHKFGNDLDLGSANTISAAILEDDLGSKVQHKFLRLNSTSVYVPLSRLFLHLSFERRVNYSTRKRAITHFSVHPSLACWSAISLPATLAMAWHPV